MSTSRTVQRRDRARSRIALLALVTLTLAGALVLASQGGQQAAADQPWVESGWSGGELPNVTVVLRSIASSDPRIEARILPGLSALPGVRSAFVDVLPGGPPVIHLRVDDSGQLDGVIAGVESLSESLDGDGELLTGGQLVADADVEAAVSRATLVAVVPVVVIVAVVAAALYGLASGVAVGLVLAVASLFGGLAGSSVAGTFDGSLATTTMPGALVALLVASVVSFRLLTWFKHPLSGDAAENILGSVRHQLPDLALVIGALAVTAVVAGLLDRGVAPAGTVLAGAVFGTLTALATLPAFLATQPPVPDNAEFRTIPMRLLDGRDFPLVVVITVAAFLLGLGLIASRASVETGLLDAQTVTSAESSQVTAQLVALGGDPSAAIRATASGDPEQVVEWARAASRYPGVAWAFTSQGRIEDGEFASGPVDSPAPIDDLTVIVSPTESARSELTQDTVAALRGIDSPIQVRLDGEPVRAEATGSGSASTLWLVVALLAVTAGVAVYVLIGDPGLAAVAVALRLLTSAALLGSYHIMVEGATAMELQLAVLIVGTGITYFEVGMLRMIAEADEPPVGFVTEALRSGGGHAVAGLAIVALAGIGLLAADLDVLGRFGVALAVAVVTELLLGVWLLRPVVLGEQAMRIVQPGIRGRTILGRRGPVSGEPVNPEWRRVVSGLLREEFRFQTEPGSADLGTVFVEGTPLFNELSQHNLRLRQNGLRIAGEGPQVVSVKAVNDGDPVTVAITVDHPSRQLLGPDGRLLGIRAAERRDGMLWLTQDPSGRYRISEAVDLGSGVPIPDPAPAEAPARAVN